MSIEVLGVSTSTTSMSDVAPNTSANTKGSWVSLGTTSAQCDAITLVVAMSDTNTGDEQDVLVDIGVGGTPSSIIDNILFSFREIHEGTIAAVLNLPVTINNGVEISARCQSSATSGTGVKIAIICHSNNFFNTTSVAALNTYGANTGDSGGVSVDAGGTANTKGSYSEIDSSVGADIKALWLLVGMNGDKVRSDDSFLVDIAVGAAESESVILEDIPIVTGNAAEFLGPIFAGPFEVDISSGTRLAARCQSSTSIGGDRAIDVVILGASSFS